MLENLSRPGEAPAHGDWVRDTVDQAGHPATIEFEFHDPAVLSAEIAQEAAAAPAQPATVDVQLSADDLAALQAALPVIQRLVGA